MKNAKIVNAFGNEKNLKIWDDVDFNHVPEFKRMCFYFLYNFLEKSNLNFCALLGPRQIGKTIALKQINKFYSEKGCTILLNNFKELTQTDLLYESLEEIFYSIKNNTYEFILLDEITYIPDFSNTLLHLNELIDGYNSNIKIILTGSSSSIIKQVCQRVIANNIKYLQIGFLNFYEYLVYQKKLNNYVEARLSVDSLDNFQQRFNDIIELDYFDYVKHAHKFCKFNSIRDYLEHCVDENIISRSNLSWNSIYEIDNAINIDVTLGLLYAIIYSLHRPSNWKSLKTAPLSYSNEYYVIKDSIDIKKSNYDEIAITTFLASNVKKLQHVAWKDVKTGIHFLYDSGLIILQFQNRIIDAKELHSWFKGDTSVIAGKEIKNVTSFFASINTLIKSPIPYVVLMYDLVDKLKFYGYDIAIDDVLKNQVFGSYLETAVKGAFSESVDLKCLNEFRDDDIGAEIDLVSEEYNLLLEISKKDKKIIDTWFSAFPDSEDYLKILVGASKNGFYDDIYRVSYPILNLWLNSIYYYRLML